MKRFEKVKSMSLQELAEWRLMPNECDVCPYADEHGICSAFENKDGKTVYECCLEATVTWLSEEEAEE